MMKKSWKNRSGVSPVIATILMVAITVVLAAVLYVMVMGFGGGDTNTITGTFTTTSKLSTTTEKVQFGAVTPTCTPDKINIVVSDGTNSDIYKATKGAGVTYTYANTTALVTGIEKVAFVDLAADGNIASGDSLTLTVNHAGTYTVTMLNAATGATIHSISFTF
jgi:flagellin-like protein